MTKVNGLNFMTAILLAGTACGPKKFGSEPKQIVVSVSESSRAKNTSALADKGAKIAQMPPGQVPALRRAEDLTFDFERVQFNAPINLSEGASFVNSKSIALWGSEPNLINSLNQPLRAKLAAVEAVPRVDCDGGLAAAPAAYTLWCIKDGKNVHFSSFNPTTARLTNFITLIPDIAVGKPELKIVGANVSWLLLKNQTQVVLVDRKSSTFDVAVVELPKFDESGEFGVCSTGGAKWLTKPTTEPLLWLYCQNTIHTFDLASAANKGWTSQKVVMSGMEDALAKDAIFIPTTLNQTNGTVTWGAALYQHNKLYFTKGLTSAETLVTSAESSSGNVVIQEPVSDPFWDEKGRGLIAQYCTKCHHPFGSGENPDRFAILVAKKAILERMGRMRSAIGTMPPYAATDMPTNARTELYNWLNTAAP